VTVFHDPINVGFTPESGHPAAKVFAVNVPEQKLLRITFFLLRPHDAPYNTGHEGNHENNPDDHMKWPKSAVAPTVRHSLGPHDQPSSGR
jgi:hypothetical protein